jgi:hypothetical protein
MRNTRLVRLIALLSILLALYGCAASQNAQAQTQIHALLQARDAGVNQADRQQYLSTVLPSDTVLLKEENNLIRSSSGLGIKDFKLTVGAVLSEGNGEFSAALTQSYTVNGEARRCSYNALFKLENGKLYYDGPDFAIKQNSAAKVYYQSGKDEALAQQLLNEETNTVAAMKEQLGYAPAEIVNIKLFDDQQVFLQSVKLDLPGWVGGWHEYGEAIKSFTGAFGSDGENYKSMLNHETTHLIVSELSNDNATYWLQEGLAGIYENKLDDPGAAILTAQEVSETYTSYSEQKKIDLEKIGVDDQGAVGKYYATSKAFAAFMVEKFGWGKVRQMLEYMKKFELIPVTADEKISTTNDRTDEAIASVLGLQTNDEFQSAFDKWLTEQSQT